MERGLIATSTQKSSDSSYCREKRVAPRLLFQPSGLWSGSGNNSASGICLESSFLCLSCLLSGCFLWLFGADPVECRKSLCLRYRECELLFILCLSAHSSEADHKSSLGCRRGWNGG